MEHAPQEKSDEEYPLLRVETKGGDGKPRNSVPVNITTTGWNVTWKPKKSWCTRWPEFISAFWMTLILLAISFLVFYALGMSAYRRQPIVIVKCNNSKPGSDVFYHHIIPRDSQVPFSIFSNYLSSMARQYPSLRFSVYFLIDDSLSSPFYNARYPKSRILNRLAPHMNYQFNGILTHNREIKDFQGRYQNVNICVMLLSKYMTLTPLKFKWRLIPPSHLAFYARIYEVWQNGGIGFDLVSFNNQYNKNEDLDRRIDTILKTQMSGIEYEKQTKVLNFLDNEEESKFFSIFSNFIDNIVNKTRLFFNTDLTTNETLLKDIPKIRSYRNKRSAVDDNLDVYIRTTKNNTVNNTNTDTVNDTINNTITKLSNVILESNLLSNKTSELLTNYTYNKIQNLTKKTNNIPQPLFFYDVSWVFDNAGPPYYFSKPDVQFNIPSMKTKYQIEHDQRKFNYLILTPEGEFVATSSRHHPFLSHLFSTSCFRLNPKYAINDMLLSQCSGFFRNDIYCESIRVIYNAI